MRITGVVKGDKEQAQVASIAHGLVARVLHVLEDCVTLEFIAVTTWPQAYDMQQVAKVLGRWFCETSNPPFAPGTLLLYSRHEGDSLPSEQGPLRVVIDARRTAPVDDVVGITAYYVFAHDAWEVVENGLRVVVTRIKG